MIYFVTETYLKTNTPITANVDVTDVTPYVKTQSDLRIQPILGSYFYNYLLTQYNNQVLNPDEELLVAKIQPCIAWYSAVDAVFGLSYQLKNKGLQQQNGDYSTSVSRSEVAFGMEHYEEKAAFYERRLREWLKEQVKANPTIFPEFVDPLNTDSDMKPLKDDNQNGYNIGILII
jgi:hypothetical protein